LRPNTGLGAPTLESDEPVDRDKIEMLRSLGYIE
jgi:hypothetical protein